jgi:hypothetical protein
MLTYWLGDDGLPQLVFAEGWLYLLRNYTDSAVDIVGVTPGQLPRFWNGVDIDPGDLRDLRDIVKDGVDDVGDWPMEKKLKATSTALSIAGCAVGVSTAATGVGVALAAATCGGAAMGVYGMITDNDLAGTGSTIINAVTCGTGSVGSCASLGLDVVADNYNWAKEKAGQLRDILPW